jgi:hypothetical protein
LQVWSPEYKPQSHQGKKKKKKKKALDRMQVVCYGSIEWGTVVRNETDSAGPQSLIRLTYKLFTLLGIGD